MRTAITLVILLLGLRCSYTQTYTSISANSRVFAVCTYEGKVKLTGNSNHKVKAQCMYAFRIDAYDLQSKHKFSSFRLKFETDDRLDTVYLSPNGLFINLSFKNADIICQVKTGKMIGNVIKSRHESFFIKRREKKYFEDELTLAFANQDNIFFIATNSNLIAYDSYTGQKVAKYKSVPVNTKIVKIFFSDDDHYIILQDDHDKILVWKTGTEKLLRRSIASDFCISENKQYMVFARKAHNAYRSVIYKFPQLRKTNIIDGKKYLREVVKEELEFIKNNNIETDIHQIPSKYIDYNKCQISPGGKYSLIPIVTEGEYYTMYFINNFSEDTINQLEIKPYDAKIRYKWINDSLILISTNKLTKKMFNIQSNRYVGQFNYFFDFDKGGPMINFKQQEKNIIESPDFRYSVLEHKNMFSHSLYVKPCTYVQGRSEFKNISFITYTPDSKMIIGKNDVGDYCCIPDYIIDRDLGGQPINPLYFNDTVSVIVESEIFEDSDAPTDYHYARIKKMKHIREQNKPSDQLKIYLKSVIQNDSVMEVQFHLIDDHDIYYYGAASDNWKDIFCNVMIKEKGGVSEQLDDFQLVEYDEGDSLVNSFAVVMDHSGSMGNNRARKLQNGTVKMIDDKHSKDAMSILKFDEKIGVEAKLETNKKELLSRMKINGLEGFGGGTALLDGINAGISTIKDQADFDARYVVLFTDGNENCSMSNKREIIKRAIENNIRINTVGFGEYVSDEYLKSLSYYTGGSFHRIYKTEDLDWIMEDIYNKSNNYYGLRLKPPTPGVYTVFLKLCPPVGIADTLVVEFEFNPEKIKKIKLSKDFDFSLAINDDVKKEIDTSQFNLPDIADFKRIKLADANPLIKNIQVDTASIEIMTLRDEFEKLKFPDIKFVFDKTEIVAGTDKELANVIEFMKKYQGIKIEISGHTDGEGDFAYNQDLSERRAQKVKSLMVQQGISEDRIRTIGYGETLPIDDNISKRGRQENRRVEFSIIDD